IVVVIFRTCLRFVAARRLRELPDFGISYATLGRRRRMFRKNATLRWTAAIVVNPECDRASLRVIVNVIRGNDRHTLAFLEWHRRTINSRAESRGDDRVDPAVQIRALF